MAGNRNRYKQMERYMCYALLVDVVLFVLYLIVAGNSIILLKVILAIAAIAVSVACLAFLYMSQELLRPRSMWMSACAAAVLVCILASLLLNYPSVNPYKEKDDVSSDEVSAYVMQDDLAS